MKTAHRVRRVSRVRYAWAAMSLVMMIDLTPTAVFAEDAARRDAKSHFESGVDAFQMKRFAEAVQEFELAYKAFPAFQVLYNIGQVNVALGRHVEAIRALADYLSQGGPQVSAERRAEVEAELRRQYEFVGRLRFEVEPDGATLSIDGVPIGRTPLEAPVFVTAGTHAIEARLVGYGIRTTTTEVPPNGERLVEMRLERLATTPVEEEKPRPSSPPAREPPRRSIAARTPEGYLVGAVGLGLVSTAGIVAIASARKANAALDRMANAKTGSAWDVAKSDYDSGTIRNEVGLVVTGVGVATVGLSIFMLAGGFGDGSPVRLDVVGGVATKPSALILSGRW